MDEKTAQEFLQSWFQDMGDFEWDSVVINDYSIFDSSKANGAFLIIENSDTFISRQETASAQTQWDIPVIIVQPYSFSENSDQSTFDDFRDARQAIINKANDRTGNRTVGDGAHIVDIRSGTPVINWYAAGSDPGTPGTFPIYLIQQIIMALETF